MIGVAASGSAVYREFKYLCTTTYCCFLNVWCCALYLLDKQFNSHESRFNLNGLLTNST